MISTLKPKPTSVFSSVSQVSCISSWIPICAPQILLRHLCTVFFLFSCFESIFLQTQCLPYAGSVLPRQPLALFAYHMGGGYQRSPTGQGKPQCIRETWCVNVWWESRVRVSTALEDNEAMKTISFSHVASAQQPFLVSAAPSCSWMCCTDGCATPPPKC